MTNYCFVSATKEFDCFSASGLLERGMIPPNLEQRDSTWLAPSNSPHKHHDAWMPLSSASQICRSIMTSESWQEGRQ
jgi:hypothetical protein